MNEFKPGDKVVLIPGEVPFTHGREDQKTAAMINRTVLVVSDKLYESCSADCGGKERKHLRLVSPEYDNPYNVPISRVKLYRKQTIIL